MSGRLRRVGELFVAAPATDTARPRACDDRDGRPSPPRRIDQVGLVAARDDLLATACAVATVQRRTTRARAAVICCDAATSMPVVLAPPTPPAAALARRLADRGLTAQATARQCLVRLPAHPAAAARDAWRAIAAARAPVCVAVSVRADALDAVLGELDAVVAALDVAGEQAVAAALAMASLERLGPPVRRVDAVTGPVARYAALAGLLGARFDGEPSPGARVPAAERRATEALA